MQALQRNRYLVESAADLATIPPLSELFLDTETASDAHDKTSVNPHHTCRPIGISVTGHDHACSWFIPWELCVHDNWLQKRLNAAEVWVNHNLKYDAHVLANHGIDLPVGLRMCCTKMLANLIDSDRSYKGGYSLDALAKSWCSKEYRKEGVTITECLNGSKDYGSVPISVLAAYACTDVVVNRALYRAEVAMLHDECLGLFDTEQRLTRTLFDMERVGLRIVPSEVRVMSMLCLKKMVDIEEDIENRLGYPCNPTSRADMFDLICNRYNQPVRLWTEDDDGLSLNPSFKKDVLHEYIEDADTPPELVDILKLALEHRRASQHRSMFYEKWTMLAINGVLHAQYNQNLRTGRLSCADPNEQQLDKEAKSLIHPAPSYRFLSYDQDQVEFRLIIHYIDDEGAIAAYNANPDIDFHDWVAALLGIYRRAAKTINFSVSFGMGLAKLVNRLIAVFRIQGENINKVEGERRARNMRALYFAKFPTLVPTTKLAERLATARGYVRNIAGRRLHLPGPIHNHWRNKHGKLINRCHIALCGRVVQSTAADVMKRHAVEIQPLLEAIGARLVALVHDEYVFEILERDNATMLRDAAVIRAFLESTPFELRVPLRVSGGWSSKSWAGCDGAAHSKLDTKSQEGQLDKAETEDLVKYLKGQAVDGDMMTACLRYVESTAT